MKSYIAFIWRHYDETRARVSRDGETLSEFKTRVFNVFPSYENWHAQFSEFKAL